MLNRVESGERELDITAQEVLSKYVGWGGLSEVFDESREGQWKEARTFLKDNLSQAEYEAARESTLTSFYTPKLSLTEYIRRFQVWDLNREISLNRQWVSGTLSVIYLMK